MHEHHYAADDAIRIVCLSVGKSNNIFFVTCTHHVAIYRVNGALKCLNILKWILQRFNNIAVSLPSKNDFQKFINFP